MSKFCANCGNKLPYATAKFCPECGTRVKLADAKPSEGDDTEKVAIKDLEAKILGDRKPAPPTPPPVSEKKPASRKREAKKSPDRKTAPAAPPAKKPASAKRESKAPATRKSPFADPAVVAKLDKKSLSEKSTDELISIIFELRNKLPKKTDRLKGASGAGMLGDFPYGVEADTHVATYTRLPTATIRQRGGADKSFWRIKLISNKSEHKPLGLDIYGDVFVGRAADDIHPDLDLTIYDMENQSVSRHHALLRPTQANLFLIDLGSTNGTRCNGSKLNMGTARKLQDKDTVTFGEVRFSVRIVNQPEKLAKK